MGAQRSEVFIVDDDELVRTAFARLLRAAGHAVRTFGSARELLESRAELGPGCLVLDVRLPDLNGLELYRQLQQGGTFLPVIFLTGFGDIPMSVQAIKAGAFDFLTKPVEDATLLRVIEAALGEEAHARAERVETEELSRRYRSLTPREVQVMGLVLEGRLNKQIARELGISEKTVKVHRSHVMRKMGARRVANLVHYAVRLGGGADGAVSSGRTAGAFPLAAAPVDVRPPHSAPARSATDAMGAPGRTEPDRSPSGD